MGIIGEDEGRQESTGVSETRNPKREASPESRTFKKNEGGSTRPKEIVRQTRRSQTEGGVMKSMVRAMVVLACFVFAAVLSSCGGGSSQQSLAHLTIAPAALPNGIAETLYSQTIQASGGVAPFTWAVSAGALPHHMALSNSVTNTMTISGTPDTAAQGVAFTIKVTDSASQSATQSYTVSILAEPETLTFSPSGLSFGVQLVGTASGAQAETLTNTATSAVDISSVALTGANAADFSQSNTCGSSLAGEANCTINVTFTPSELGPRSSAAITITDNTPGSPHSVSLSGMGLTSGTNATWSASSLTFGNQVVGTTSPAQSLTLSNYGTTTLSIVGIAATANFGETDTCGSSLPSGASCTINITFMPSAMGSVSGTLSVADTAPGSPQTVSLSGIGAATTATLTPGSMNFSCVARLVGGGCTPPQIATLTNTGVSTLNVLGISVSGLYFSQTNNCPSTLDPGQSCAITVSFEGPASRTQPKKETFTGLLVVNDTAAQTPQEVSLTGTTDGVP